MKRARRIIAFLNLFPRVPGRVWVDAYSLVALVRFIMGLPVDATTLGVILGTYAVSSVAKSYVSSPENADREVTTGRKDV